MAKNMKSAKDESEIQALVAAEIQDSIAYQATELDEKRRLAVEYFNGIMSDTPAQEGWSTFQSRDVSDVIGWVLPGIIRVFSASDRMVDYQPRRPGDEDFTEEASDYANFVFWNDNPGYRILWDGTHDSLVMGDGIVKVWWDDSEECEYSVHTGLTEMQIAALMEDGDVEIIAAKPGEVVQVPSDEMGNIDDVEPAGEGEGMAQQPVPSMLSLQTYDLKIKRTTARGRVKIRAVEPENFLKDRESITIDDARFVAHRDPLITRSKLIEMGFDKDIVDRIPRYGDTTSSRVPIQTPSHILSTGGDPSMDRVELYECYIRMDINDDGVAETVRAYYAGQGGAGELLDWEVYDDEIPFVQIPCEPTPHQFGSRSLANEAMDIQRIKTVLYRQMLDNTYQVNNPQKVIDNDSVLNMDEVINPTVGGVIIKKVGTAPIQEFRPSPIMDVALGAVQAMDNVLEMRTGVSRTTQALDPETLQNQTATASNNQRDAAYSQVELIARNQAELGWKFVFNKLLKLIVKHQDRPRMIRLRDEWHEINPKHWNSAMDATINVGLGTGSRDRDMAMLNNIAQSQIALGDRMAGAGMPEKALEMLPKVIKTFVRIAEAAGIKNAETFYPEFGEEDVAAAMQKMQEAQGQPDPKTQADMQKMQAEMEMKGQELQLKQMEAQSDLQLRREQMQAEAELRRYQIDAEIALKREQLAAEIELKRQTAMIGAISPASGLSSADVNIGGEPG